MKSNVKGLSIVLTVAILVTLGASFWIKNSSIGGSHGGLEPGSQIPVIAAQGWLNGEAPSPEDLQGKVTVVHAWFYG